MSKHYMLMFSLGPVQSFIAQARKTRDLWLGSFLFSKLMEAALADFSNGRHDAQLIFPGNPMVKGFIPDLPNKYVAIFDEAEQARSAAIRSQQAIYGLWGRICEDVWRRIFQERQRENMLPARRIWERQINPETLFEIFWVVVKGDECSYHDWLEATQRAFDARKRLRDFRHLYNQDDPLQLPFYETGEKSTISGSREALHGDDISRDGVRRFWRTLAKKIPESDLNQGGEERLDAIDTVKRFALHSPVIYSQTDEQGGRGYPSTSSIATAPYVEQLLQQLNSQPSWPGIEAWRMITREHPSLSSTPPFTLPYLRDRAGKHKDLLKRDGDCYFADTFTVNRLDKTYRIEPAKPEEPVPNGKDPAVYKSELDRHDKAVHKVAETGSRALSDLLRATDALGITRPTPYYAMIQMDGDRMGILLSRVEDLGKHQAISAALSLFSRDDAPQIVEKEYPARLIYAGGDDVFALAPLVRDVVEPKTADTLSSVLGLVDRLQERYCQKVSEALAPVPVEGVSASIGIAIAHHYTSLSYVRRMAKAAEDLAKKRYGRDALVVSVVRRSGEQTTVGCHWRYPALPKEFSQPLTLFEQFFDLFKQGMLSPKCVYILLEEAPALIGMGDTLAKISRQEKPDYKKDARVSEIKRVLHRQSDERKLLSLEPKIDLAHLAQNIVALADVIDGEKDEKGNVRDRVLELDVDRPRRGLIEVLGWLQVMVFLTRKERE